MTKIALGRDIHGWLIRGMEYVALQTPPPDTIEMQAFLAILRRAQLVTLLVDEPEPDAVIAPASEPN